MKKFILIAIVIIIGLIIFIGYYPPFFPFLKYGLFSKPLVEKNVFLLENFPYKPTDSQFLSEVEKIVKDSWYDDAYLGSLHAYPFWDKKDVISYSYRMEFFSNDRPFQISYFSRTDQSNKTLASRLEVIYNEEVYTEVEDDRYHLIWRNPLGYRFGSFLNYKVYKSTPMNNHQLTGTTCIDKFICQFMLGGVVSLPEINLNNVQVSISDVTKIISAKNPNINKFDLRDTILILAQWRWDAIKKEFLPTTFPYWFTVSSSEKIGGIKIDAATGEIFDF